MLEKTLESPLDCKEIQPVHTKGNQSWIFIGSTDAEAESPVLWSLDAKNWLLRKDPDAGKDWRWEDKAMTEDEMVGWHHRLNEHEFGYAPGVVDGQGSLSCFSPRGHKIEHDWVAELNELMQDAQSPVNSSSLKNLEFPETSLRRVVGTDAVLSCSLSLQRATLKLLWEPPSAEVCSSEGKTDSVLCGPCSPGWSPRLHCVMGACWNRLCGY